MPFQNDLSYIVHNRERLSNTIGIIFGYNYKNYLVGKVGMEEKRGFFRLKNTGHIKAKYGEDEVFVIDISPSSASILAKEKGLVKDGVLEIVINHFSIKLNYKLLKKQGENTVITFDGDEEINNLLSALKNIRDFSNPMPDNMPKPPAKADAVESKDSVSSPKIEDFARLNSLYSIRLYHVLRQYLDTGYGVIGIPELRTALGIDNFKTYCTYAAMKRNILDPSIKEINDKTDVTIHYTKIEEDKRVIAISFSISTFASP